MTELQTIVAVFSDFFNQPLNIYTDSAYIACSVPLLERAGLIKSASKAGKYFSQLQCRDLIKSEGFEELENTVRLGLIVFKSLKIDTGIKPKTESFGCGDLCSNSKVCWPSRQGHAFNPRWFTWSQGQFSSV